MAACRTSGRTGRAVEERNSQWHYLMTTLLPRSNALEIADPRHEFWPVFHAMDEPGRRDAVLALARDAVTVGRWAR